MENRTRASLIKALSYCSLRELPEKYNGEDVWIKALALVKKNDGGEYFVAVEKNPLTLVHRVKKDFGPTGAIVKYEEFYPYLYLSSEYIPTVPIKTKEDRVKYLSSVYPDTDWGKHSSKELYDIIIGDAILAQLRHIASNYNYTDIDEYGQDNTEAEIGGYEDEVEGE